MEEKTRHTVSNTYRMILEVFGRAEAQDFQARIEQLGVNPSIEAVHTVIRQKIMELARLDES